MSSQREDSIPHKLRTAAEPRQNRLYPVRLSHVEQVNPSIRLLQFTIPAEESNVCPTYLFENEITLLLFCGILDRESDMICVHVFDQACRSITQLDLEKNT